MHIAVIKLYIYIKPNVCVCLVFQLRHILFSVIKINIHVAILIQCTKYALIFIYIYIYKPTCVYV